MIFNNTMKKLLKFLVFLGSLASLSWHGVEPSHAEDRVPSYFDIIEENINHFNDPSSSIWFEPQCNLEMTGEFGPDTVAAFEKAARQLDAVTTAGTTEDHTVGRRGYRALCLSSYGGDLHAALDLIPKLNEWIAVVPKDASCSSACAIAFMGAGHGVGYYADVGTSSINRREARYLHYKGHLSFHAPILDLPKNLKSFSKEYVLSAYERSRLTMGRVLYRHFHFGDGLKESQQGGAIITQPEPEAKVSQILSEADFDPFLPASLFFAFITTPNDSELPVETIEQALVWRIQIYGLTSRDYIDEIPEFWLWQACSNLAWFRCHNPGFLSNGCNILGVQRESFSDFSTLPIVLQKRPHLGIEKLRHNLSAMVEIERVALGNNYSGTGHAYGAQNAAECGLSIYRESGKFFALRGEHQPKGAEWRFGNLASATATEEETRWSVRKKIPLGTESHIILRPWMWLPINTKIDDADNEWLRLDALATIEHKLLVTSAYRVLHICNTTAEFLSLAVGYTDNNTIKVNGWYPLEPRRCIVPIGIHSGNDFYIHGLKTSGQLASLYQAGDEYPQKDLCLPNTYHPFVSENYLSKPCRTVSDSKTQLPDTLSKFTHIKTNGLITKLLFGELPLWGYPPGPYASTYTRTSIRLKGIHGND